MTKQTRRNIRIPSWFRNLVFCITLFYRLQSWDFEGQSWATDDYTLVKLNRAGEEELE